MTPRPNISLRPACPEDAGALSAFFGRYYKQYKPASYFLWHYFSAEMPAVIMVADDGAIIRGTCGIVKRGFHGGRNAGQITDILVDTEFRGSGLFGQLLDAAMKSFSSVDVYVVLPNERGRRALERQRGWTTLSRVPLFTCRGQLSAGCVSRSAREPAPVAGLHYDDKTCRWRFDLHPFNRYETIECHGVRGRVKVFSERSAAEGTSLLSGDIVQVDEASPEKLIRWLSASAEWFENHQVGEFGLWSLDDGPLAGAALASGFERREQARWFCVAPGAREDVASWKWRVCAADAEFY